MTVYVDDVSLCASDKDIVDAKGQLLQTIEDLRFEKSPLNPSTKINYIGYTFFNVQDKLVVKVQFSRISKLKLKRAIRRALPRRSIKARTLAKSVSTA